jgi:hypothetical protein
LPHTPTNDQDNTGVLNADPDDAIDKRDTVGVNDPLRFSIKSSRLFERVGEIERDKEAEDPNARVEWRPPMRGEMPEEMDRSSWMSDTECVRGRPSMTSPPPTEDEGEGGCCWSSVEPGPVKKQNLKTSQDKDTDGSCGREGGNALVQELPVMCLRTQTLLFVAQENLPWRGA